MARFHRCNHKKDKWSKSQGSIYFMGENAQEKEKIIAFKNIIIKSAHPSPLSAHNGFFGSHPFSKTNKILLENKLTPIDWSKID